MIRRPPRSTQSRSSAASDVYKRQLSNQRELFPGEDAAGGVGWVAQYQSLGPLLESSAQLLWIKCVVGRAHVNENRLRTREYGVRFIVLIEWGEDDYLVSRLAHSEHGGDHGLGSATGDDYVGFGIQGQVHEATLLGRQSLPEVQGTPGNGILMRSLRCGPRGRFKKLCGRVKVRETLGEVNPTVLVVDKRHPPDY